MAKVLLIHPSSLPTLRSSFGTIAVQLFPPLNLAMLAAVAMRDGHKVTIRDYSYRHYTVDEVIEEIKREKYDVVGFTSTTPLFPQVIALSKAIKTLSRDIFTLAGGAHPMALPELCLEEAELDAVCTGEGEHVFSEILRGTPLKDIPGLAFRSGTGEIVVNPKRPWDRNLDALPFPAWELFDLEIYRKLNSRLMVRKGPAGFLETSRGCVFRCDYCGSPASQGNMMRKKSVDRVIEEIKFMRRVGFKEFSLVDNIFTTDVKRVKELCRRMLDEDLVMPWQCHNGLRVDSGDQEMFDLMGRTGCYRAGFGFESGNENVLQSFGKGGKASLDKAREVCRMARRSGMQVLGFFMVGLLQDTEETMEDTIRFAKTLEVDLAKVSYCIPFPGTPMYRTLREKGLLDFNDWNAYNIYVPQDFFTHPTLPHEVTERYYKKAYRQIVLANPGLWWRHFTSSLRGGTLPHEVYYAIRFMLAGARL